MDDSDVPAIVLTIIEDDRTPAQARVLALVEMLDRVLMDNLYAGRDHSIAAQVLARAVAAVGRPLLARDPFPTVAATLAAAEAYAKNPNDETERVYQERATASFPYGPGDGHLGVGDSCEPGSGCPSGAGTLFDAGHAVGFNVVICVLITELAPWLRTRTGRDEQTQ
jgi:hypothetical protein